MRTYLSSYESDVNWEEESNDRSEYSYVSKGISSISKFESEVPFQSYVNQLEVGKCEEELSTPYEDKRIIYKDRLPNCVDECLKDACSDNQQTNNSTVNAPAFIVKLIHYFPKLILFSTT